MREVSRYLMATGGLTVAHWRRDVFSNGRAQLVVEGVMDIIFIRSGHLRAPTNVTRGDGVHLSVPVFGPLEPIPHDLAHYVIENELDLQDGFWGSVRAGAIFQGMRVLCGRQPPHARERSHALMKANHTAIMLSEYLVDVALRMLNGARLADIPLPAGYPETRRLVDRNVLLHDVYPAVEDMRGRWRDVPTGGALLVTWREPCDPRRAQSWQPPADRRSRRTVRPRARSRGALM